MFCPGESGFTGPKKFWCYLVIALLLVGIMVPALAAGPDELRDELKEIEEDKEKREQELAEYRTREEQLEAEINRLGEEMEGIQRQIDRINREIEAKEQEIEETEEELREAEEELKYKDELLKRRLRAMHERGSTSYLEVLLGASSFGDFLSRFNDLRVIADNDARLVEEVEEKRDAIILVKEELEAQKVALEGLRREAVVQKGELERTVVSRQRVRKELEREIQKKEAAIAQLEEEAAKLEEEIRKLITSGGGRPDLPLLWPVASPYYITDDFGYRPWRGRWHGGLDIGTGGRTNPIFAAAGGEIVQAGWNWSYGNYIIIDHGGDLATLYAHLSSMRVRAGDRVLRGDTIGNAGTTGVSTGIHLHFEVRDYNRDPLRYYPSGNPDYRHDPKEYLNSRDFRYR